MTEQEWLVCDEPRIMLDELQGKASVRKLRLLACACCRRIWELLADQRSRSSVEIAEDFADEVVSDVERAEANRAAWQAHTEITEAVIRCPRPGGAWLSDASPASAAAWASDGVWGLWVSGGRRGQSDSTSEFALRLAAGALSSAQNASRLTSTGSVEGEARAQADLIREIFGNPDRSSDATPKLGTQNAEVIRNLSVGAYEERVLPLGALDNACLQVLADALEEAGSTDAAILDHLRSPGPHVRGCWALDFILGRE